MKKPYGIVYLTSQRMADGSLVPRYVGQHRPNNSLRSRHYLGSGVRMFRAIKKHTRHAFVRETLEECFSPEELDECEKKWIAHYNAWENPEFFNLNEGGNGTQHMPTTPVHRYTLEGDYVKSYPSLVAAALDMDGDESFIRAAASGKKGNTAYSHQWRLEKVEKCLPVTRYYQPRPKKPHPHWVGIECYDLKGNHVSSFPSVIQAQEFSGHRKATCIIQCCRGERESSKGWQWRYSGHTDAIGEVSGKRKEIQNTMRAVVRYDLATGDPIAHYKSLTVAAKDMGLSIGWVWQALRAGFSKRGCGWKYAD